MGARRWCFRAEAATPSWYLRERLKPMVLVLESMYLKDLSAWIQGVGDRVLPVKSTGFLPLRQELTSCPVNGQAFVLEILSGFSN